MRSTPRTLLMLIAATLAPVLLGGASCNPGPKPLRIQLPLSDQLSLTGDLSVSVRLASNGDLATFTVELDSSDVTGLLMLGGGFARGTVPVASAGPHQLVATIDLIGGGTQTASQSFETVALQNTD